MELKLPKRLIHSIDEEKKIVENELLRRKSRHQNFVCFVDLNDEKTINDENVHSCIKNDFHAIPCYKKKDKLKQPTIVILQFLEDQKVGRN